MKARSPQADMLLHLGAARVEDTVGPERTWLDNKTFCALLRRRLVVCEPTPRTGIAAVNLTDAGRAEADRIASLRAGKRARGGGARYISWRGMRVPVRQA